MDGGYLQSVLFLLNRPEPIRQASLLMVLASGMGDAHGLVNSLRTLAAESNAPWKQRVSHLCQLLEQGHSLSQALAVARGLLPEQTMIAIRIGEETGALKQVLADEAHRLMSPSQSHNPVRVSLSDTLVWLMVVGCAATSVVGFIMLFIVPKMKKIFEDFGTELPRTTLALITVSDATVNGFVFLILPVVTVIAFAGWYLFHASVKRLSHGHIPGTNYFPRYWSPLILRMLSINVAAQRSLESGLVCLLREFPPGRTQQRLSAVRMRTESGYGCWESMQANGFLTTREVAFLESATKTHHLDWGLIHLARKIERQRDKWMQRIVNIIQPVTIMLAGLIVAFVCIALFQPLIDLIVSQA